MRLPFIRSHSTSAQISARSDRMAESAEQIGVPALEPVRVERSTSNTLPPKKEHIHTQSGGHDKPERGNMTSSSLAGMHIQFRTLTFHSRPEEQLQYRLYIKKSVTSLPAAIGFNHLTKSAISLSAAIEASDSPLGPRP
jgi:hypothetical protein